MGVLVRPLHRRVTQIQQNWHFKHMGMRNSWKICHIMCCNAAKYVVYMYVQYTTNGINHDFPLCAPNLFLDCVQNIHITTTEQQNTRFHPNIDGTYEFSIHVKFYNVHKKWKIFSYILVWTLVCAVLQCEIYLHSYLNFRFSITNSQCENVCVFFFVIAVRRQRKTIMP